MSDKRSQETPEQKYRRKLRRRFDSAMQDLAITISRAEPGLSLYDLSRLIDLVSDHTSVYAGVDSPSEFRGWLYQRGLRFAHLWAIIKTNLSVEEWLLNRLPDYVGDVNDVDAIEQWVHITKEQETERLRRNSVLARWLFSNPVNVKAVHDGGRAVGGGPAGEVFGLVYEWVCSHGERLLDSPSDTPWAGRLYGLARELALGWRTERIREGRRFPVSFDENSRMVGYVDGGYDGCLVDPWSHATGPLPTADEQNER
jgi:hypothetical protein